MVEIKKYDMKTLEDIYGKKRFYGYVNDRKKKIDGYIDKYPILKNESVFLWIASKLRQFEQKGKNPKDFQITTYLRPLQNYINEFKEITNPDDLLDEYKVNRDKANNRLLTYLNHLLEKNVNEASVKNAYQSRIKSFYSSRGCGLTEGLETLQQGVNDKEIDLNKDKLQNILNHMNNPQYKVIAKLQALLGLRIGDVLKELTASKSNNQPKYKIEKFRDHYCIRNFTTQKEDIKIFNLFFPKELMRLLQTTYQKEDLTKLKLNKDILRTRNGNIIHGGEYGKKLKKVASKLYKDEKMTSHSLRKYFYTRLGYANLSDNSESLINETIGSEVEDKFKEHLMGHKVHYSSNVYSRITTNREVYYNLWSHIEKSLCIDCEIINTTSRDIKRLNQEILDLKSDKIQLDNQIKILLENIEENTKRFEDLKYSNEYFKTILTKTLNIEGNTPPIIIETRTPEEIVEDNKKLARSNK